MGDVIRGIAPRNGLPEPKYYVYRGTGTSEPPAAAAARLRHRAIDAEAAAAARLRHRAIDAGIERRVAAAIAASDTAGPGPDDLGCEWRRERPAEDAGPPDPAPAVPGRRALAMESLAPAVTAVPPPVSLAKWEWCDGCGYLTSCCRCADGPGGDAEMAVVTEAAGHYQAAQAVLDRRPEPGPGPASPAAKPARCKKCGYVTTAAGHKVACDA